jgi:hypothetical protein
MVPVGDGRDARAIRGREAMWDFYLDVAQTLSFGPAHFEFMDAGGDKVLAISDMKRTAREAAQVSRWTTGWSARPARAR